MSITTEQKEKLILKALLVLTRRIQREKALAYLIGPGTNTYDLVTASVAVLNGQNVDQVRNNTIPGSAEVGTSLEDILEVLK